VYIAQNGGFERDIIDTSMNTDIQFDTEQYDLPFSEELNSAVVDLYPEYIEEVNGSLSITEKGHTMLSSDDVAMQNSRALAITKSAYNSHSLIELSERINNTNHL
jgi:hypothetical protein